MGQHARVMSAPDNALQTQRLGSMTNDSDHPRRVALATFQLNGEQIQVAAPHHWTLLEALRYRLGLTGTKQGCDKGDCGACTVRRNGHPVLSCLTLVHELTESDNVETVESLGEGPEPHPLQDAFDACGAAQCGFCSPGILMTATALLETGQDAPPTREEIGAALGGNLCRCTGYTKILDAVEMAWRTMHEQNNVPEGEPSQRRT